MSVTRINRALHSWVNEDKPNRSAFFVSLDGAKHAGAIEGNVENLITSLVGLFSYNKEAETIARVALRTYDRMKSEAHEQQAV